jgi:hypothetical protein
MVRYVHVAGDQHSLGIETIGSYRAVVLCDYTVPEQQRMDIARDLCKTGCRYMMAWGPECSRWDDDVDWANRERFDCAEPPESHYIMTTWHDDESLDELFWFAKTTACYDGFEWNEGDTLLVHFGDPSRKQEFLDRYENCYDVVFPSSDE